MANEKVKGLSFEDMDKALDMTKEKKLRMASYSGNPKLKMPTPNDRKTDKIIRFRYSKDSEGKLVPIKEVPVTSPKVESGILQLFTVEDHDDLDVEYDMNFNGSIFNELTRIATKNGVKRTDLYGKWFKLSAETYFNKTYSKDTTAYRLTYMKNLNSVTKQAMKVADQDNF